MYRCEWEHTCNNGYIAWCFLWRKEASSGVFQWTVESPHYTVNKCCKVIVLSNTVVGPASLLLCEFSFHFYSTTNNNIFDNNVKMVCRKLKTKLLALSAILIIIPQNFFLFQETLTPRTKVYIIVFGIL